MTSTHHRFNALLTAAALAIGCGSAAPEETATAGSRRTGGTGQATAPAFASGNRTSGGEAADCNVTPVYFAFDSSDLDSRSRDGLSRSTRCLSSRPTGRVRVTGMADPRGTEEYNLALGERRARTVADYMRSLGVDGQSIATHSVGEEMATGRDESGWANDRRAEVQSR